MLINDVKNDILTLTYIHMLAYTIETGLLLQYEWVLKYFSR